PLRNDLCVEEVIHALMPGGIKGQDAEVIPFHLLIPRLIETLGIKPERTQFSTPGPKVRGMNFFHSIAESFNYGKVQTFVRIPAFGPAVVDVPRHFGVISTVCRPVEFYTR